LSNSKQPITTVADAAQMLADAMDRPAADIQVKLESYMQEGVTINGAVARFKSENKFQLGAGRIDVSARFLGIEPSHPVTLNDQPEEVTNMHFAVFRADKQDFMFVSSVIWTTAKIAELKATFEKSKAYKFKASMTTKDGLMGMNRLSKIELLPDEAIPAIEQIEVCPLSGMTTAIGRNELVRGTIGKLIQSNGKTIGFELSDISPSPPLTVWLGGKYPKMPAEEIENLSATLLKNDEVIVFGNVKQSTNDINMNAISITRIV